MRQVSRDQLITLLVRSAIYAELCISANFLTYLGLPYVTDGGPLIFKLHPGTDLLLMISALILFLRPTKMFRIVDISIYVYFSALSVDMLCALIFTGMDNLIVLVDTFLPAGMMAALLTGLSPGNKMILRLRMQYIFCANSALALTESLMQQTLIPLYLGDGAYQPRLEDFRPTALYDHPLTGAVMTMMALALTPSGGSIRVIYLALNWAALIAFGGRSAIFVSLLALLLTHGVPIIRMVLLRDQRAVKGLLLISIGGLLASLAFVMSIWLGFAERLAGHLYWDASAQVRLAQWDILTYLDTGQLVFGTPRHELLEFLNVVRLKSGVGVIENFWLLMFLGLGAIGFPLFLITMSALCYWCWRFGSREGRALLISVLLVASTSNSLGRKSTVLVCLVASVACTRKKDYPTRLTALCPAASRPIQATCLAG